MQRAGRCRWVRVNSWCPLTSARPSRGDLTCTEVARVLLELALTLRVLPPGGGKGYPVFFGRGTRLSQC
jgi:hypothetical protein